MATNPMEQFEVRKIGPEIEISGIDLSFTNASLFMVISAMMILVNELYKYKLHSASVVKTLCQLMAPFAPHIAEELWSRLGGEGLCSIAPWPEYDEDKTIDDTVTMGVQVNGKMRGTIEVTLDTEEEQAVNLAKQVNTVANAIDGKNIVKVIYKAGRILNIIAK